MKLFNLCNNQVLSEKNRTVFIKTKLRNTLVGTRRLEPKAPQTPLPLCLIL